MERDYAVILAWPETRCKEAGAWYDTLMALLGVNQNGYYRVGHAALILISGKTGTCEYYDFGRYHAPKGYGRVRSKETDHELEISTRINFSQDGTPLNMNELLEELDRNHVWHGEGKLEAGISQISIEKALSTIQDIQEREFVPYGPFNLNGTNCSRFAQKVVVNSMPPGLTRVGLSYPPMLTPTPAWNVRVTKNNLLKMMNYDISIEAKIA